MEVSYFSQYIEKYFRPIVEKVTELINGKEEEEKLYYKTMLTEEFSSNLLWGSKDINGSIVAADVVSLGSSLPLKKRDSISVASGSIPKIGMKLRKDEKTIQDIQIMLAAGATEAQVAQKIFDDVPKAIKGVELRKEYMFLQGLSSGISLAEDADNTGIGVRVNYGYKSENTFASAIPWGEPGYTPNDDVDKVMDKIDADGNAVMKVMLSKKYFNLWKNSDQGKTLAANFNNVVYTNIANLPVPSKSNFLMALEDEYSCTFEIVDSTIRTEKNGVQTSIKPWEQANIVFLYDNVVGRLVYGTCAEQSNPVTGVAYQSAGQGTLISKYSKPDPIEEFTTAQALALPVIDGVHAIYLLQADETAISIDPASLDFAKTANTTGKDVTVTTLASTITAVSDSDWATVSVSGKVVKVKTSTNTGAERTAVITITDSNTNTISFNAVQATGL